MCRSWCIYPAEYRAALKYLSEKYVRCKVIEELWEGKFLSIQIFFTVCFMVPIFPALGALVQFFVLVMAREEFNFINFLNN